MTKIKNANLQHLAQFLHLKIHVVKFTTLNEITDCIVYLIKLHLRDMKMQHIKFEILKERLCLFYCNYMYIQHNFVHNMFSIGQICKENFQPFGDVMVDVTKSLNACHK